jgi:hypothetical protein
MLIKGDRRLVFEQEPARRQLPILSFSDVVALGDETVSSDQVYLSVEESG